MRKLAVAMILILTSLVICANPEIFETEKPITCSDVKTVIEGLSDGYNEQPFWIGNSQDSKYILMVNPKTNTWTMVQYNDKIACVVGTGNRANQIFLRPST